MQGNSKPELDLLVIAHVLEPSFQKLNHFLTDADLIERWRVGRNEHVYPVDTDAAVGDGPPGAIVDELAPDLVTLNSIGRTCAAQLLLTAGDNPERLRSEASFAALCGVSPVPASSGKTIRYRLNRGGDRAANSALHIIAIGRLRTDPKTKAYVARRVAEGYSKLDANRALKRYIAREVFSLIIRRQN